jgi:GntR family transcriptional repressor for pyruvate dehydrogenase complex
MKQLASIKNTSLINRAVETLTDFILRGRLEVGSFLPPELELCRQLGVGRSTLREALKVIESQGLVKKQHGKGVQVVDESHRAASHLFKLLVRRNDAPIDDIIEVRGITEIEGAALAARRAEPQDIVEMEEALQVMLSEETTLAAYVNADLALHMAIARATHNQVLVFVMETISPLLVDSIYSTLCNDPRPEFSWKCHQKLVKTIRNHDPEAAAQAMREHHEAGLKMLAAARQEQ